MDRKTKSTWKDKARNLKSEIYALYFAYKDSRVHWYARLFTLMVVAYAFSPIDLIPDFIPILGYLDDVIILPLGIMLAIKMIPLEVMNEARNKVNTLLASKPTNWYAAMFIIFIWVAFAFLFFQYIKEFL